MRWRVVLLAALLAVSTGADADVTLDIMLQGGGGAGGGQVGGGGAGGENIVSASKVVSAGTDIVIGAGGAGKSRRQAPGALGRRSLERTGGDNVEPAPGGPAVGPDTPAGPGHPALCGRTWIVYTVGLST